MTASAMTVTPRRADAATGPERPALVLRDLRKTFGDGVARSTASTSRSGAASS